jgi:hypothetical protein
MIYVTDDSEILLILYWIFTIYIDFFLSCFIFSGMKKQNFSFVQQAFF